VGQVDVITSVKLSLKEISRVMNKKTLFFVFLVLVIIWGCAGNLTIKKAERQGARQLTGIQLLKLIPDNILHLVSWNNDMRVVVVCRANGKIIAENNKGEKSDGGWSISEGDKLCLRFSDWSFADKICYTILQQDEKFMAFRSDGGLEYNFTLDRMPDKADLAAVKNTDKPTSTAAGDNGKKTWWQTLTAKEKAKPIKKKKTKNDNWWNFWGSDETPSATTTTATTPKKDDDNWWNILTSKKEKKEPEFVLPEEEDDNEHWWDIVDFWDNGPDYNITPATPLTDIQKQLYKTRTCPKCDLVGLDMHGANLEEADLSGANLAGVNLEHANLSEANLTGADLSGANLAETNLIKANLSGADLTGANLHWAILSKAKLSGAKLKEAYMVKADCYKADFTDADMTDAVLQRANLDKATGLSPVTSENKNSPVPQAKQDIQEEDIK
jgi:hypothetical protein